MSVPAIENFSFDIGEHWPIYLTCYEDEAQTEVMDLTGAQKLELRFGKGAVDVTVDLTSGAQVTNAAGGVAFIVVTPAKQVGLVATSYPYTVRVTKADGVVSDQLAGVITARLTEFGAPSA